MTIYDSQRYARINRWDRSHLDRVNRLVRIAPGDRVLEIGCGRGHLTEALARGGAEIIGIDANPRAEELAASGLVRHMRAEELDFDDETFDVIVSVHAIEHIPRLERAFSEMVRVLVPGGQAVFVYPAEPIKGLFAIPTSFVLHGHPFKAREVHCQKLWPEKVRRMLEPMGMRQTAREFSFFKSPQFSSAFEKVG